MGLDVSHGDFYMSYGHFNDFRGQLLILSGEGYLEDMEGFGGLRSWDSVNDDIKLFINHSDCDGDFSPEDCQKIATRLSDFIGQMKMPEFQ